MFNPDFAALIANPPAKRPGKGRQIGMRKINGKWVQTNEGPSQSTQSKLKAKKQDAAGTRSYEYRREAASENGKKGGRKKGSKNSAEVRAKQGASIAANNWRRNTPDKGAAMQSASGLGEADYTIHCLGRVFPRFPMREGWYEWD